MRILIPPRAVAALTTFGSCMVLAMASHADDRSALSLAHVEPYTAEFEYYVTIGDGEPERAGYWTDALTFVDGLIIRTVERFTLDDEADLVRSVVADQATLAPIRVQQKFGTGLSNLYQLEFDGLELTQVLIGNPLTPARIATAELPEPVVETGLQAVFALSLPPLAGSEPTVTSYVAGANPTALPKTYHVVGQESVRVMGQDFRAWRIEDRAAKWTYWLRREKPYILKVSHPVPGGGMATSFVTRFD